MKIKYPFLAMLTVSSFMGFAQNEADLNHFPEGKSPQEIGKRIASHFVESPHPRQNRIIYPEVCAWYGALTFAQLSKDKALSNQLEQRFEKLINQEVSLIPIPNHVDFNVFGAIPLQLFLETKKDSYLKIGKAIADTQWVAPWGEKTTPEAQTYFQKGYTWQTRLWIDDMYMITAVQAQAYRATGETKYINRAAKEMVMYLDSLQRPNGLFFHAPDVPYFWSRGNGWMAAGMAELLRDLPKNNPDYPRILKGYKTMMASLLKYQAEDGMWRQLLDDPNSWNETSGTGMFTFAMITGVKNGWLNQKTYGKSARKAWLSLIFYIDDKNDIREVCEGTNKKNDHQYYLDRKRIIGDMHGQAPVLWCASALLR
jgi:unsaturated rhamnogalacturonyl hydrolase